MCRGHRLPERARSPLTVGLGIRWWVSASNDGRFTTTQQTTIESAIGGWDIRCEAQGQAPVPRAEPEPRDIGMGETVDFFA